MGSTGIIKRFLPFLATFAVGIFVASFFVSVAPNFGRSEWKSRKKAECRRLKAENERLRNENERLKLQLDQRESWHELPRISHPGPGPEFPVEPPPPPAPRRSNRTVIVQ